MSVDRAKLLCLYNQGPDAVIAVFEKMDSRIMELEARIAELEARLGQNSRNSNWPPSSDVFIKPKSQRVKGERRMGGQNGHPGSTLKQVDCPDNVVVHRVEECHACNASLADVPLIGVERRQVFEIPPLKISVTEHRAETKQCPCCRRFTRARFPRGVRHPVQYGVCLKAFIVYLLVFQLVPYDRIAVLFRDLFGHSVGKGTMVNTVKSCYRELGEVEHVIRGLLKDGSVLHADETGFKVDGRQEWLHVASTSILTWYGHHRKRGLDAMRSYGIMPCFTGIMVHDFWKPYFSFRCGHAICNSHLVRELQGISEAFGQEWSSKLKDLIYRAKKSVDDARCKNMDCLDPGELAGLESEYDGIMEFGIRENLDGVLRKGKRGPLKQTRAKNLLDRCVEFRKHILEFMYDFRIPYDNNQAERDIRMVRLHEKISGTTRSDEGADWFCRIRGYISTCRKNNQPVLNSIVNAFEGHPFTPAPAHYQGP
jgi:transposase